MAAEVDICNLALAHLGDSATVASISPPSGSAQSSHCARFYPIARDLMIDSHPWNFCTTRVALAALTLPAAITSWLYAYAVPTDVIDYLEVMDPAATDDYGIGIPQMNTYGIQVPNLGVYVPQPFVIETDVDGTEMLLTNQQNAVLRYTHVVSDASKFPPLFVMALSRLLASYLAGPLLKGEAGATEATRQYKMWKEVDMPAAEGSDANNSRTRPPMGAPWITNR